MTSLSNVFSWPHPAPGCFVTAGDGDTSANLDVLVESGVDAVKRGTRGNGVSYMVTCLA